MAYETKRKRLSSNEVIMLAKSIRMENWELRSVPGRAFGCHAYQTINGNDVHVEMSIGTGSRSDGRSSGAMQMYNAQIHVDGYVVGESNSKVIQNIYDGIVEWKKNRGERFVELIRGDRENAQKEIVSGLAAFLAKKA